MFNNYTKRIATIATTIEIAFSGLLLTSYSHKHNGLTGQSYNAQTQRKNNQIKEAFKSKNGVSQEEFENDITNHQTDVEQKRHIACNAISLF